MADPVPQDEQSGPNVLIVDDDPGILSVLKMLLERSFDRIRVLTATSPAIGLEWMESANVDLVISDYKMPGMDGLAFLRRVRREWPGVPCVMMTAYADLRLATEAINKIHVDSFLEKPLDNEAFLRIVYEILKQQSAGMDETPELRDSWT